MHSHIHKKRKSLTDEPLNVDDEVVLQPPSPAQSFIIGGISAAQHSDRAQKGGILSDVAHVLGCTVEALGFLIGSSPSENSDFDFPDAERRRFVGRQNHLNIAE